MRTWTLLLLCLMLSPTLACKKDLENEPGAETNPAEATPQVMETEVPGTTSPADLSPAVAETRVDSVTVGHALAADGTIAADQVGDDFAPGQTVNVAMDVTDAPADSAVKVVWYGPGDTRIGEDTKTITAGQKALNFATTDTSKWAQGDYRVEVWLADEKVAEEHFNIVPADQAGK